MSSLNFLEGITYKVCFEKSLPIVFRFIKIDELGNTVCEDIEKLTTFNFNELSEHYSPTEM